MPSSRPAYPGQLLSERELQIVTAIAEGLSNEEVGQRLGISRMTVKSHLWRIGPKLGTGDRAGIVAAAIRSRQLDVGAPTWWRVPVVCACQRCAAELAAGEGMAARIAGLQLTERAA